MAIITKRLLRKPLTLLRRRAERRGLENCSVGSTGPTGLTDHDSSTIHSAVLSVVAKPLADALNHVQKQYASRPDINPLLGILSSHTQDHQGTIALYRLLLRDASEA